MGYTATFIQVAPDCPAVVAVVPTTKGDKMTVAVLEHELLASNPYRYTQEALQFAVHVRRRAIPEDDLAARRGELWAELFSKPMPCLRASPLPKRYGWGIHYDTEGRIDIYPVESEAYRRFSQNPRLTQLLAMRNKRG